MLESDANRLAPLAKLGPDDLQGLFLGGIMWGRWEKDPPNAIGYVGGYPSTITARELESIKGLTGLRCLSVAANWEYKSFSQREMMQVLKNMKLLAELNLFCRTTAEVFTDDLKQTLPQCRLDIRPYFITGHSTWLHPLDEAGPVAALDSASATRTEAFTAILPGGVSVELVGVCDYLKDQKRWWRPDGSPLSAPPYDKADERIAKGTEAVLAFAFRVHGQDPYDIGVNFSDTRVGWSGSKPKDASGRQINDLRAIVGAFSKDHDPKLDIVVQVKAGPRERMATYRADRRLMQPFQFEGGGVVFNQPREENGALIFTASHTDFGLERGSIFIAYDKAGNEHPGESSTSSRTNGFELIEHKCPGLRLADLDRIEYLTQRYAQVTFKNVSLSSDLKTDFSIGIKPAPERKIAPKGLSQTGENSADGKASTAKFPDGSSIELVGVCDYFKDKNSWWRPDGTSLPTPPFASTKDRFTWSANDSLVFVLKLSGRKNDPMWFGLHDSHMVVWSNKLKNADGKIIDDLQAVCAAYPKTNGQATTMTMDLSIDEGPPALKATWPNRGKLSIPIDGGTVFFDQPEGSSGDWKVTIAFPELPMEIMERFVAYDRAGKKYRGGQVGTTSTQGTRTCKLHFDSLPLEDLDRIEYLAQPQSRVLFKNVAISPDVRTDFRVAVQPAPVLPRTAQSAVPAARTPSPIPEWRKKFDQVYRLQEGEYLKRIAPPFIPERLEYYAMDHKSQAQSIPEGPNVMTFDWDGSLFRRKMAFGPGSWNWNVAMVLHDVIGLTSNDYDCPAELLNMEMPGDWIARKDAEAENLLQDLGKILETQFNKKVKIERRHAEQDVFVARGRFDFKPMNRATNPIILNVYVEKADTKVGGGGGVGSVSEFLRGVGDKIGIPIIDQSDPGGTYSHLNWRCHMDLRDKRLKTDPVMIDKVLKHISDQTSLTFRKERRPVEVWVISRP